MSLYFFGFQIHIFVYPSNTYIHRVITLPWQKDTGNERFRPRSPRGSNLSFQLKKTKKLWHSKKSQEILPFLGFLRAVLSIWRLRVSCWRPVVAAGWKEVLRAPAAHGVSSFFLRRSKFSSPEVDF